MENICTEGRTAAEGICRSGETLAALNEASFMLNDLGVYLDANPGDERAAGWFDEYNAERERLLAVVGRQTWRRG